MPQVIFKIPSYELVAEKVFWGIKDLKDDYKKVIYLDLPDDFVKEIINKDFSYVKNKLIEEIKKKHNIKELEKYKKEIERYWNPLNNLFFKNLKKIMGFDFEYKEYIVYITKIRRGSYTTENIVFTNPTESIRRCEYITAEELLHLHYWDIFKKTIKDVRLPWRINKKIWKISETIPEFILTDDLFKKFGWGKNLNRKYPFIEEIKKELAPIWKNKKNFKDFMIKVHKGLL